MFGAHGHTVTGEMVGQKTGDPCGLWAEIFVQDIYKEFYSGVKTMEINQRNKHNEIHQGRKGQLIITEA